MGERPRMDPSAKPPATCAGVCPSRSIFIKFVTSLSQNIEIDSRQMVNHTLTTRYSIGRYLSSFEKQKFRNRSITDTAMVMESISQMGSISRGLC
jgi:hypothetical protein